jgi:hypothetical protein
MIDLDESSHTASDMLPHNNSQADDENSCQLADVQALCHQVEPLIAKSVWKSFLDGQNVEIVDDEIERGSEGETSSDSDAEDLDMLMEDS